MLYCSTVGMEGEVVGGGAACKKEGERAGVVGG